MNSMKYLCDVQILIRISETKNLSTVRTIFGWIVYYWHIHGILNLRYYYLIETEVRRID